MWWVPWNERVDEEEAAAISSFLLDQNFASQRLYKPHAQICPWEFAGPMGRTDEQEILQDFTGPGCSAFYQESSF